jgi:hypothetical protein
MLIPKDGTLERIVLDKLKIGDPVSYLDFIGTGITEKNIDQVINNLRNNMFIAENDHELEKDS